MRFILADSSGELHEKIESSKSLSLISGALQDYNQFIELIRTLTPKSAEEFFCSMLVMRRDFMSAIQHIESMKMLLDWTVRAQSSNLLDVQLEIMQEVVGSVVKADIFKILFYDSKLRAFSSVCHS